MRAIGALLVAESLLTGSCGTRTTPDADVADADSDGDSDSDSDAGTGSDADSDTDLPGRDAGPEGCTSDAGFLSGVSGCGPLIHLVPDAPICAEDIRGCLLDTDCVLVNLDRCGGIECVAVLRERLAEVEARLEDCGVDPAECSCSYIDMVCDSACGIDSTDR